MKPEEQHLRDLMRFGKACAGSRTEPHEWMSTMDFDGVYNVYVRIPRYEWKWRMKTRAQSHVHARTLAAEAEGENDV